MFQEKLITILFSTVLSLGVTNQIFLSWKNRLKGFKIT